MVFFVRTGRGKNYKLRRNELHFDYKIKKGL